MNNEPNTPPSRRSHRLWIPAVIGIVTVAAMVLVKLAPELERNYKAWLLTLIPAPALLLVLLWFILLSRFRWRTRLLTAAGVAITVFVLTRLLRFDGSVSGTGLPRLTWKWSAARSGVVNSSSQPAPASPLPSAKDIHIPDVPQFFGPNRDGIAPPAHLARDWSATPPKLLWRQPIGLGWSAFAVVEGRAFTEEQRGDDELVTCYEMMSGRLIWAGTNHVRFTEWQGGDGPRATPTVDHGRVFAMGGTGIFDCLDAATGKKLWSHDVVKEIGQANLNWGMSCSPLVFEDKVVVTGGRSNRATVIAYSRESGDLLWKAGTEMASYASPILTRLAGKRVILSLNGVNLTAHDPASGKELLRYAFAQEKYPKASQPVVVAGDRVFLSAGYGAGCVLLQISAGKDGSMKAAELWKGLSMKTQFNSVAVRDGFLYGIDDGLLACVDVATGKRKWKDGRYGSGETLLVDDLILIQSESGAVALALASPERYQELSRFQALNSKTWNHPVLAGRYLLVRNDQEAACYELPVEQQPVAALGR